MQKITIGPSTGWLHAAGINRINDQSRLITLAEAGCYEICLSGLEDNDERLRFLREGTFVGPFSYRSLHLPDIDSTLTWQTVDKITSLVERHQFDLTLTHPLKKNGEYPTAAYDRIKSAGIKLGIENMDGQKPSGFAIDDLKQIAQRVDVCFVLDAQHAYERDPTMAYANDLFEMMKPRLFHLHVSGETEDNCHSLLCKADNANAILDFVSSVLDEENIPLILEGQYSTAEESQREITFIQNELR